ncbi:MAG TPA: extracellular solute-binding protein [Bauldia sp.]|nr:extracellular solute-binding protein [Bauldia sp.]
MARPVVRVYQEDWWPFQNLPKALRAFTEATGIETELSWDKVGVGSIETMFEHMVHSFTDDDPPYDLICTDEVMLRRFAVDGRVMPLNDRMRRDGVALDDVTEETRRVVTVDGAVIGLPCINVVNLLLYRRDLLDRYSLPVPQSWEDVKTVGLELQAAVRRDGTAEFYAFATRGAGGGGHAVWSIGSVLGSYGGRWLVDETEVAPIGEEHRAALAAYLDVLKSVAPPDQGMISFVELMRDYRKGRVGMIVEVGMEYAHLLADDPLLAERSGVAMVPAGPNGRRPNLYAPPWSIPARSRVKDEAWELAKYLSSPAQLLEDGIASNAIETSSLAVLYGADFDRHYRADLLAAVRASRAVAFEERPFGRLGMDANVVVGQTVNDAVEGRLGLDDALARIHAGLVALAARA